MVRTVWNNLDKVRIHVINFRGSGSIARQKKENNLAIILVAIVMVFFCCHSLKFFLSFYKVRLDSHVRLDNLTTLGPCYLQDSVLLNPGAEPVLPQVDAHHVLHQPPHAGAQQLNQLHNLLICRYKVKLIVIVCPVFVLFNYPLLH